MTTHLKTNVSSYIFNTKGPICVLAQVSGKPQFSYADWLGFLSFGILLDLALVELSGTGRLRLCVALWDGVKCLPCQSLQHSSFSSKSG